MSHRLKSSSRESSISVLTSADWPKDVVRTGYLRKLKKLKRKFFVLRKRSGDSPSRLEYYPSEKKWRSGNEPKKSIALKSCFSISRKLHPKHKHVICLYSHWECFSLVLESEEEQEEWLASLIEVHANDIEADGGGKTKTSYDHVWQVIVDDRELEFSRDLNGPYCLGLTAKSLSLIKTNSENFESLEFPLMSIRRCGHSGKHFFIELGRSAITGAGGVWMETEGTVVAQNMHETILSAMKSSRNKEDLGPHSRPRSASTSENSKPIATRRPVGVVLPQQLPPLSSTLTSSRERCDALPPRARTISENMQEAAYSVLSAGVGSSNGPVHYRETSRPHSLYAWPTNSPVLSSMSYNPSSLSASLYSNSSLMSFDEPDGYQETSYSWYPQTSSADDTVTAAEHVPGASEKPSEYLLMSPTDDNMNILHQKGDYLNMNPSTSQPSSSLEERASCESIGSSPRSCGAMDYVDMRSPSSSNPESYIPMNMIGSFSGDEILGKKMSISSLSDHSVAEKLPNKDGYVPMAPGGASEDVPVPMQDGYLSMSPLSSSLPKQAAESIFFSENSESSNSSMFGSNPAEFKLDKVRSLLKQTDDDSEDFIKPVRAYSIGSRSQIYECRARAYSMGSERGKSDFKASAENHSSCDTSITTKSSSAPLLQHSAPRKASFSPTDDSGYDLMEMDSEKQQDYTDSDHRDGGSISKKNLSRSWQRSSNRSSCATSPLLSLHEINERLLAEADTKTRRGNNEPTVSGRSSSTADSKSEEAAAAAPVTSGHASDYVEMSHHGTTHTAKFPASCASPVTKAPAGICTSNDSYTGECDNHHPSPESKDLTEESDSSVFLSSRSSPAKPSVNADVVRLKTAAAKPDTQNEKKCSEADEAERSSHASEANVTVTSNTDSTAAVKTTSAVGISTAAHLRSQDSRVASLSVDTHSPDRLSVTASSQGEYVNLTLGAQPQVSPPSTPLLLLAEFPRKSSDSSLVVPPTDERNYMNIKLGKPFTPLPNPALVSSTAHPVASPEIFRFRNGSIASSTDVPLASSSNEGISRSQIAAPVTPTAGKSTATKSRAFCLQSLPVIRKQMSAPAVPPSLKSTTVSPARKSSCPVTASASMIKTSSCSTRSTSSTSGGAGSLIGLLKMASGCSPDHSATSQREKTSPGSVTSTKTHLTGTAGEHHIQQEAQYENVSLPMTAGSGSRPSSVSSEKELNYASLDLAPTGGNEVPHSPCTLKLTHQQPINEEPLTYAEIDFTKSEGLRHTTGAVQEGRL